MACSSGCRTPGAHSSWGECVRAKRLQVEGVEAHKYNQGVRAQQNEYAKARMAGLQPEGIGKKDVEQAWAYTEHLGVPYRADDSDQMIHALNKKDGLE